MSDYQAKSATNERPQAQTTVGVIYEVTTTHQLNSKTFADVHLNIYDSSLDWLDWIYLVLSFRYFCWMRVNNLNLNLNNNIGQTFTPTLQSKTSPGSWVSTKVESIKCNFDGRPPLLKQSFDEICFDKSLLMQKLKATFKSFVLWGSEHREGVCNLKHLVKTPTKW